MAERHWLEDIGKAQAKADYISPACRQAIVDLRKDYDAYPYHWQQERRIDYLQECLLPDLIVRYWQQAERLEDYIVRVRSIEMVLTQETMQETAGEITKALREIRERQDILNGIEDKRAKDRITPEMIERARAYPFDQLIEFNRAGFAPCPWHEETSASLHFNRTANRIHCFGCHKDMDSISYIQDREGLTFPEAVRRLQ